MSMHDALTERSRERVDLAHDTTTITRFASLYATQATAALTAWSTLFDEFSRVRPFLGTDKHPGWSAARFDPPKRELANVRDVSALVLDVDNKGPNGKCFADPVTIEAMAAQLGGLGCLIHTTRSNTPAWPRFRVIIPFARPVSRDEYAQIWPKAERRWPGLDPAPKDPSRFWFAPGIVEGACFEAIELPGAPLDPDEWLAEADPAPVLAPRQPVKASNRVARAHAYAAKMPPAIEGAGGHAATWAVARWIVADLGLSEAEAMDVMREYNKRCKPPWDERDLRHKVRDAAKARVSNPVADRPRYDDEQPEESGVWVTGADPLAGLTHLNKVALVGRDKILKLAGEPISYIWQDIAVAGTIVLISGPPAEGKTTLLFLILAARLNYGEPVGLLGRQILPAEPGKYVVLVEGEHSEHSTSRKLVKSFEILGLDDAGLDRVVVVARKAVLLGSPEWRDVVELIRRGMVSDVALDTIARIAPADANDEREQVAVFAQVAQAIETTPKGQTQPLAWAVAHNRKNGEGDGLAMVSGSAQRTGQADTVLMVKGEKVGGQTVSSTVTFAKLREDPDDYPKPSTFAIERAPGGGWRINGEAKAVDDRPLEVRIMELVGVEPRTKTKLGALLGRSNGDVDEAITNLFATRQITTTPMKVNGRDRTGFIPRRSTGRAPDEAPDPDDTGRAPDENETA